MITSLSSLLIYETARQLTHRKKSDRKFFCVEGRQRLKCSTVPVSAALCHQLTMLAAAVSLTSHAQHFYTNAESSVWIPNCGAQLDEPFYLNPYLLVTYRVSEWWAVCTASPPQTTTLKAGTQKNSAISRFWATVYTLN